jgi:AAHS family 4-hydroxybenzoate transporter-like MFS transporter
MAEIVDVAEVIERQPLGRFTLGLVVASWLVTFFDGYDMTVISFTSKHLIHDFQLSKAMLGNVFSVGIFGTLVGGLALGWLGDRLGRRPAILIATAGFSLLTAALGFAHSYQQLLILRFLGGVTLGGAIPLLWALNIEFAPRRFRARVVTTIMLGYGFGVSACGPLALWLIPRFGWPGVFWFGGVASLLSAVLLLLFLPESLRYLASKGAPAQRLTPILRRMAPAFQIPPEPHYVLTDEIAGEQARKPFHPGMLFKGELRLITPLLWLAYVASSLSTFFLTTWGPTVLSQMGFGDSGAAWVTAANSLCGAAGALVIMNFTDGRGPISIAVMPAVAAPLLLVAGLAPMGLGVFLGLSLFLSVFLGGGHYAVQSIVGGFYPSAYRANGGGWAGSVAKLGSVAAPLIGAAVLSTGLPVKTTYALLAVCPAVFGVCILTIGLIERRRRLAGPGQGADAAAVVSLAAE